MGRRLLITRIVARLALAFVAVFLVVLVALDVAAYLAIARADTEALRPALGTPEGDAALRAVLRRAAAGLALLDLPLLVLVGAASYGLATLAVRPLLAARERESRFAADAAHELRTPLARIGAIAQTAREAPPDERARALERIAALAVDASILIGDLLALVREERLVEEVTEPVDLARLAADEAYASARGGVRFAVSVPPAGAYVLGDERRLRRLVRNLADNAGRHARAAVEVRVAHDDGTLVLTVEDDGDGVPDDARERIFERFVRLDPGAGGSGLGLAIARDIARAHGGELALEGRSRFVARFRAFAAEAGVNEV